MSMKKAKKLFVVLAAFLMAALLSGCITVELKVNRDGSCEVTYIIDTSSLGGLITAEQVEESLRQSVEEANTRAGKTVAVLKSVKEDKKNDTITALVTCSDLTALEEGAFFGTVKGYRKNNGPGLDNLVNKKGKAVDEKDIPDDLHMVYFPGTGGGEFSITEVIVTVPGTIEYLVDGAELEKNSVARFKEEEVLVVFRMGGGGFPVWIIPIAAIIIIILLLFKLKKPSAAPVISPPVTTNAPDSFTTPDSRRFFHRFHQWCPYLARSSSEAGGPHVPGA